MKNVHRNESTNDDIYHFKLKLANFLFYLKQVYVETHRHSRRQNQQGKEMVHYSMRWRYNTTLYKLPPLCFHHKYTQWRHKLIPLSTRYWKPLRKDLLQEDGGSLTLQEIQRPWRNLFFATVRHLALFLVPCGSFQYFRPVTHCASVTLNKQWTESFKSSSKITLCRCPPLTL
jgi:hypothetical protein